jgi:hypothetical protein
MWKIGKTLSLRRKNKKNNNLLYCDFKNWSWNKE